MELYSCSAVVVLRYACCLGRIYSSTRPACISSTHVLPLYSRNVWRTSSPRSLSPNQYQKGQDYMWWRKNKKGALQNARGIQNGYRNFMERGKNCWIGFLPQWEVFLEHFKMVLRRIGFYRLFVWASAESRSWDMNNNERVQSRICFVGQGENKPRESAISKETTRPYAKFCTASV